MAYLLRSSWRDTSFPLSAEEDTLDIRIRGEVGGRPLAMIATVDEDVGPMGDGQGLAGVLLDDRDRGAGAMDRADVFEQPLCRDWRQTVGRFVEQQELRLDHP